MCLAWTVRQRRLGIDDFGNPLTPSSTDPSIIITRGPEDGQPVEDAVHDAVEADVHSDRSADSVTPVDEATPLLKNDKDQRSRGLLSWLVPVRR